VEECLLVLESTQNNGGAPSTNGGVRPQLMGARPHSERAPKNNGGAPSSCGRFGDFLLFFMQLRVDDF
jgi:hypothetical protein